MLLWTKDSYHTYIQQNPLEKISLGRKLFFLTLRDRLEKQQGNMIHKRNEFLVSVCKLLE